MVVRLPDAAGDYKFYKDRSYQIDKATSRKPIGMTLSKADLDRTVVVTDPKKPGVIIEQYNLAYIWVYKINLISLILILSLNSNKNLIFYFLIF